MKILFVAANPIEGAFLALDEELRSIEREIAASRYRERIALRACHATRPLDLVRELNRERPDVLHFSGHGNEEGDIVLVGLNNEPQAVAPSLLAELFAALEFPPKIVVLNSCFSFLQADEIIKVVDIVIGIPGVIQDRNAVNFSTALYMALCEGISVSFSFRQAVVGVKLNSYNYWESREPSMLLKNGSSAEFSLLGSVNEGLDLKGSKPRPDRRIFSDRDIGRGFLKREFEEFASSSACLSLIFIDIEGMHKINTQFGRVTGDRVITETVVLMERYTSDALAVGICGDDTFFCVLDINNRQDVMSYGRSLMTFIEAHDWKRLDPSLYVRVAAGFAIWDPARESASNVIVRAGLGLKHSQSIAQPLSEGSEDDVSRRMRGEPLKNKAQLPEEIMRQLFS